VRAQAGELAKWNYQESEGGFGMPMGVVCRPFKDGKIKINAPTLGEDLHRVLDRNKN
jgi:hypothetical protein